MHHIARPNMGCGGDVKNKKSRQITVAESKARYAEQIELIKKDKADVKKMESDVPPPRIPLPLKPLVCGQNSVCCCLLRPTGLQ